MEIYVVQRGDTLWAISRRYGIAITAISQANGITDPNQLVVGEALVIPTPPGIHVVKYGETLWMIARMYGISIPEIIADNAITDPSRIVPGQQLRIRRPVMEVNGYLTQMGAAGAQIMRDVGINLTYVSNFSYHIREDGSLTPLTEAGVNEAARSQRVAPLLSLTNFSGRRFSSDLVHTVLSSPDLQQRTLDNVIAAMRSKGYTGLNIDFEYVYPQDRELYNSFLRRTVDRLHPLGYSVSTALAPKIRAEQQGLLYEAHDYPAHGQIVDFTVLMTYEWGWAGGAPLAIAPINEVRKVLDYAVTVIPRNKILMGVPLYGRDWTLPYVQGTTIAETINPQEAVRRAVRYRVDIQYNTLYQSPFFRYTDENGKQHEVWFEDARSIQVKYRTARDYGLRGVSYWVLPTEFPQNWYVLNDTFQIRKLLS